MPAAADEVVALRGRVADLEARLAAAQREVNARNVARLALERSEARGAALLAAQHDPTVVIDDHGTIQAASDSVERTFGWRAEDLVGQNVRVLMPEPHRSAHDGYLAHYRRTGETNILNRTREFEVAHKDGTPIPCELSVARAEIPGGEGPLFIGSFRDASERKRAEQTLRESERRFRALFDEAFHFVGLLRPDGTVLEVNQSACLVGGVAREDVLGRPFWETRWWSHSEAVQQEIRHAVRRAAQGEIVRSEVALHGRGHDLHEVDFSLKPVRDEHGQVVLLIPEGHDISALKAAQRAETALLRRLAAIGESAAVLAHEVKSPITAVNVALRAVADQLGEDHQAVLEDLVRRMRRLEELMRGTLSFARPLELHKVVVGVNELFADTLAHLRGQITGIESRVRAEPAEGLRLHADPRLLEEVLSNLICNAIESGAAHIMLSACRPGREEAALSVSDDGPGIAEELRSAVLKPFVTTKPDGTGLGLAICKKIVDEHGGSIAVDSGPLGGTRVVIRLAAEA